MINNYPQNDFAILERAFDVTESPMSVEAARYFLSLKLNSQDEQRVNVLAQKTVLGTLTSTEEMELDEYRRVGRVMEILKLRARAIMNTI